MICIIAYAFVTKQRAEKTTLIYCHQNFVLEHTSASVHQPEHALHSYYVANINAV